MPKNMTAYHCFFIGLFAISALSDPIRLRAQEGTQAQLASSSNPRVAGKVYLAFRMQNWQTKHMHDADQAKTHADTLRRLGCEVKTANHDGHIDVSCRTVFWKSLALDSHDQAHQWESWLKQSGFEALYGHAAGSQAQDHGSGERREIVRYRSAQWKTRHLNQADLGQMLALYRALGCEIKVSQHDGHSDVQLRCPEWMEIELASHEAAHSWQKFLDGHGFETQHEH